MVKQVSAQFIVDNYSIIVPLDFVKAYNDELKRLNERDEWQSQD